MSTSLNAQRITTLVGDFDRSPAYAGLAEALRLLIGDGRIGIDVRLPSERELAPALGVSRTTVTRAYALLRDAGYAVARQGSGTRTRVPGGRVRAHDRALMPTADDPDVIDLSTTAPTAPPEIAAAYAVAHAELTPYLAGTGYFPLGVERLREVIATHYESQGVPTHPDQVVITNGAVSATALAARTLTRPGDKVLVESPSYPNAVQAVRSRGARVVRADVDPHAYDLDAVIAQVRQAEASMAYLVPDFHNPTGHLMDDAHRARLAQALRASGTVAVVDETSRAMILDPDLEATMPRPFAAHSPEALTVSGISKTRWGGIRVGWLRAPEAWVERLINTRVSLDLGAPVLEQLVVTHLLTDAAGLAATRERARSQRDALVAALAEHLPSWTVRVPRGGLSLWCELPTPSGTALAHAAQELGVVVTPGPVFATDGGLDRFVRLPFVLDEATLTEAVVRLTAAWAVVSGDGGESRTPEAPGRVLVG